jgi:hypothetical protein
MKKALLAILAVFYFAASSGASVYLNYCCGVLSNVSFTSDEKNCPGKSSSSKKCCDTNKVDLKVKADQERIIKSTLSFQKVCLASTSLMVDHQDFYPVEVPVNERSTGPPVIPHKLPLFIKNCIFRI